MEAREPTTNRGDRRPGRAAVAWGAIGCVVILAVSYMARAKDAAPKIEPVLPSAAPEPTPQALTRADSSSPRLALAFKPAVVVLSAYSREPIAGASLVCDAASPAARWIGNAAGVCEIDASLPENATLRVEAPGYLSDCLTAETVRVILRMAEPYPISLDPAGELSIRVITAGDEPVSDVHLSVLEIDPETGGPVYRGRICTPGSQPLLRAPLESTSGVAGEALVAPLPCNRLLRVSASRTVPETSVRVTIDPALRHAEVVIHVPRSGTIRGRIVDCEGRPVGYAKVRDLEPSASASLRYRGVSPDGRFELTGLPFRSVHWLIETAVETEQVTSVTSEITDVGDIAIECDGELGGIVVGFPLQSSACMGLELQVLRGGKPLAKLPIKPDGRFSYRLPVGAVQVIVTNGFGALFTLDTQVPNRNVEIDLSKVLSQLQIAGVPKDEVRNCGLLTKNISDAAPQLSRYSQHSLKDCRGFLRLDDTLLTLSLQPPGTYEGWLSLNEDHPSWIPLGTFELLPMRSTTLQLDVFGEGRIRGSVRTPTGQAISDCEMALVSKAIASTVGSASRVTVRSDEKGEFHFDHVVSGDWVVFPLHCGLHSTWAKEVSVSSAHPESNLSFIVDQSGSLVVTATAGGRPVQAGYLYVDPVPEGLNSAYVQRARTDEQGKAAFEGLWPGEYAVHFSIEAPAERKDSPQTRYVMVTGGARATASFEMGGPRIHLRFTRNGRAVEDLRGGRAYLTSGWAGLRVSPTNPDELEGIVGAGHAVIGVKTLTQEGVDLRDRWFFARADIPLEPTTEPLTLDIAGADVRVVLDSRLAGTSLPIAQMVSIDGISLRSGWSQYPYIAFSDSSPGTRVFLSVPSGRMFLRSAALGVSDEPLEFDVPAAASPPLVWRP